MGDLLLSRSGTIGRSFVYRSDSHPPCAYAGYLVRFSPSADINSKLIFYFTKSLVFVDWLQTQLVSSTIGNVNGQKFAACLIPTPGLPEQQRIVKFLDNETTKLDALVAKKRALIERLKERRAALISRTVTRGLPPDAARAAGLDPNPKLKSTGIDWLGDVPEHWVINKMRRVCISIRDGTHNPPDRADGVHRLLSVRNVQEGKFILLGDDRTMAPEEFYELQRSYSVREGDIVLAIVGATTGKSAIVGRLENVTVQRSLAILRPTKTIITSSFLHYVIQSPIVQTEIQLTVFKYSAQPGIYLEDVGGLKVVCPPLIEQRAISRYLDIETSKIDDLIDRIKAAIDRLLEYRAALITAAVTGKIDVRETATKK